ncbi:MAG TPA: protein kinase [Anaerolineae bacterium]|nr:protein kinase [Anaerolineae bacterium]
MSRDLVGVALSKYRCDAFIGYGGMAEVYRAIDTELNRVVAIKVLHPFLVNEEGFIERFRREARTLALLKHPNIVQIYDSGLQDFNSYVVMEYVPGPTLKDRLRELGARGEQMPLTEVRRILDALLSALRYAHQAGIVHRDLKPTNIILAVDGRVVLADFGLAKITGSTIQTASLAMFGTPAYMAPEQVRTGKVDPRSDIYSLGVTLFEMLTGRLPFQADTPFAMIAKHSQESLPRASQLRRGLSRSLDNIIFKATAKAPNERFQTIDQIARALNTAFEGRFLLLPPRLSRTTRNWIIAATTALTILGAGSAGGWFNNVSPLGAPTRMPSPTATPRILLARIMGRTPLFEEPDPASRVLTELPDGAQVELLARQELWWQVHLLDGSDLIGWVMTGNLDFIPTPTALPTLTNTPPPGATFTPSATRTATPRPTAPPSPTSNATPTPEPDDSNDSPTAASTAVPIPTAIPTSTSAPIATFSPPTPVPTAIPTQLPQATPTPPVATVPTPAGTATKRPPPTPRP